MLSGLSNVVHTQPVLTGAGPSSPVLAPTAVSPPRIARLNLLRRPLSRWAGWQGSSRGPKAPRGWLFAAAVLGEVSDIAGKGAGVLMEWSLGDKPAVQSVQIAAHAQ